MKRQPLPPIIAAAPVWLPSDPPRPAPPLLTQTEVACLLRLDAKHTDKAMLRVRARGITGIRIGNHIRYPLNEVLRFIESEMENNPR